MNPQFLFFGYPTYLLDKDESRAGKLVDAWTEEISREFDLVMILENLTESLALMVLKYCWDIDDVAHIKV